MFWRHKISLSFLATALSITALSPLSLAEPAVQTLTNSTPVSVEQEVPTLERAPEQSAPPVEKEKRDGYNYGLITLNLLVILELLGILYLIFQLKKMKQELLSERQQHAQISQQLEYQALYDALTQLPNRRLFRDRLLQTMKVYNRHKTKFGVLMCDLDHFKEVNDTLGHDAGDMLLLEVTNRMRKVLRESDTLARLGGDEFALICPSVQDMSTASVICMRLLDCMRDPIIIKGQAFQIGLSLGIALFPEHASDEELLLRRADMALYRAKQKRGSFVMFDPNIDRPKRRATQPRPVAQPEETPPPPQKPEPPQGSDA